MKKVALATGAIGVALVVGGAAALFLCQPLSTESVAGSDEVERLGVRDEDDETIYEYRYAPGGEYFTMFTIRNDGPLRITVNGPDREDITAMGESEHATIWADELLIARVDPQDFFSEPRGAQSASGASIAPSAETVWIHWRIGSWCPPGQPASYNPGSGISTDQVGVSWSVLGLPRTSDVHLGYRFSVANPGDDPLVTCPTP